MSTKPELVYFDGRGRGEIVRIVLAAAGVEFTEHTLKSRKEFLDLEPDLLFKQVPMLRVDGVNLSQTSAIVRHIGRKANLLGTSLLEQARVDELFEGTRDMYQYFYGFAFKSDLTETALKQMIEKHLEKYLPIFNKILLDSSSGYLVGASLSLADLGLFEVLQAVVDYFGETPFNDHPAIVKFYAKLTSLNAIIKYLNEIRKPKNSQAYVDNVEEVLGRKIG